MANNYGRRGRNPPWTQISWWEKMKVTKGNGFGFFWHKFFGLSPPLLSSNTLRKRKKSDEHLGVVVWCTDMGLMVYCMTCW